MFNTACDYVDQHSLFKAFNNPDSPKLRLFLQHGTVPKDCESTLKSVDFAEKIITPTFTTPNPKHSLSEILSTRQKWEGRVISVHDDSFCARLYDLTSFGNQEEAEFSLDEISDDDKSLVKTGAIFYWILGYSTKPSGQKSRFSSIYFRRLPVWNENDIKSAQNKAEKLYKQLFDE